MWNLRNNALKLYYWINHGSGGVRKLRNFLHRRWVLQISVTADKSGTVGFAGGFAVGATLPDQQMQQPGRFFVRRACAPGAKNGGGIEHKFGLHKQVAEGRVRLVRGLVGEHDFGVTR